MYLSNIRNVLQFNVRALYINVNTKELEALEKKTEEENFCTAIESLNNSP